MRINFSLGFCLKVYQKTALNEKSGCKTKRYFFFKFSTEKVPGFKYLFFIIGDLSFNLRVADLHRNGLMHISYLISIKFVKQQILK